MTLTIVVPSSTSRSSKRLIVGVAALHDVARGTSSCTRTMSTSS